MPKIASATIDEVNNRTDIVALVNEYTRLDRRGSDWWGCCPFHSEKTPSFHVLPDRKMYHCFGCGEGGGVIKFLMEMEKISFTEAVISLAKKNGVEVIYEGSNYQEPERNNTKDLYIELYTRVSGTYHFFLTQSDLGSYAKSYIIKRGISEEIIEKFELGYAPADKYWLKRFLREKKYSDEFLKDSGLFSNNYPDISFFIDRLTFPICNRKGQVIGFGGRLLRGDGPKYLNSRESEIYRKRENLYAFHLAKQHIRQKKAIILCEGYMDVIAYHQAGIQNAVALLGTALTEEQVKLIQPFIETIFLSLDSDNAGIQATLKSIIVCRKADITVKVISFKEGKDPADILLNNGVEALTRCVDSAIIDVDYLLSFLAKEYNTDTPEGKTKAALSFFPYVEALKSDIQKETSLEKLCQTFSLKPEAVKKDFNNRGLYKSSIQNDKQSKIQQVPVKKEKIKPNVELRAIIAVIANIDCFPKIRTKINAEDFEDAMARDMFIALEDCYREGAVSFESVMSKCSSDGIHQFVAEYITNGEFSINTEKTIEDIIALLKRNSLERKRDRLTNQIRQFTAVTLEDQKQLESMISEKMNIDFELLQKKDANG